MCVAATTRLFVRVGSFVGNGELKSATSSLTPAFWASSVVNGGWAWAGLTSTVRSVPEMAATARAASAFSSTARPSTDGTRRGLPLPASNSHRALLAARVVTFTLLATSRASAVSSNRGVSRPDASATTETVGAYSEGSSRARVVPDTSVKGSDIAVLPKSEAICSTASALTRGGVSRTTAVACVESGKALRSASLVAGTSSVRPGTGMSTATEPPGKVTRPSTGATETVGAIRSM